MARPYSTDASKELMQGVISQNQGFITRWALLIFLSIFIIIIMTAMFIRYPEIVKVRATLTNYRSSDNSFSVRIDLPRNVLTKIDPGMEVQLHFDTYPYTEFGFVAGKLQYIPEVSIDSVYTGYVQLPKGLITNRGNIIRYKGGLEADALIIKKDIWLWNRLFHNPASQVSH